MGCLFDVNKLSRIISAKYVFKNIESIKKDHTLHSKSEYTITRLLNSFNVCLNHSKIKLN